MRYLQIPLTLAAGALLAGCVAHGTAYAPPRTGYYAVRPAPVVVVPRPRPVYVTPRPVPRPVYVAPRPAPRHGHAASRPGPHHPGRSDRGYGH